MAEAVILLFKDKLRLNIPGCHILVQAASVEAKLAIDESEASHCFH